MTELENGQHSANEKILDLEHQLIMIKDENASERMDEFEEKASKRIDDFEENTSERMDKFEEFEEKSSERMDEFETELKRPNSVIADEKKNGKCISRYFSVILIIAELS